LKEYIVKEGITEVKVSDFFWKVRFQTLRGLKITCSLLRVDEDKVCVEFTRREGDLFAFSDCYKEIA
jgi:hypothetical protein